MSVSICILIFCIAQRPRYTNVTADPEPAVITEVADAADLGRTTTANTDTDDEAQNGEETDTTRTGKTSTRVNIRDAASADAKVLDTVEAGTVFEILDVQSDGWIKILYNGVEAYISADYVILIDG
jgi:uncharacterized protein YgiM (DUF1202 family)